MAPEEFFFLLELSSQGAPAALLDELAGHILAHVGSSPARFPELSQALRDAVTKGTAGAAARCDVQFRVRGARLDVVVTVNAGRVWQTSVAIP